ncbi:MAG: hypothetical protein PHU51_04475 [Candidatus Nanoarchaeia archaeon]|nr:hypothetical protein [Candidatus Nanoarchaeia archaeon]
MSKIKMSKLFFLTSVLSLFSTKLVSAYTIITTSDLKAVGEAQAIYLSEFVNVFTALFGGDIGKAVGHLAQSLPLFGVFLLIYIVGKYSAKVTIFRKDEFEKYANIFGWGLALIGIASPVFGLIVNLFGNSLLTIIFFLLFIFMIIMMWNTLHTSNAMSRKDLYTAGTENLHAKGEYLKAEHELEMQKKEIKNIKIINKESKDRSDEIIKRIGKTEATLSNKIDKGFSDLKTFFANAYKKLPLKEFLKLINNFRKQTEKSLNNIEKKLEKHDTKISEENKKLNELLQKTRVELEEMKNLILQTQAEEDKTPNVTNNIKTDNSKRIYSLNIEILSNMSLIFNRIKNSTSGNRIFNLFNFFKNIHNRVSEEKEVEPTPPGIPEVEKISEFQEIDTFLKTELAKIIQEFKESRTKTSDMGFKISQLQNVAKDIGDFADEFKITLESSTQASQLNYNTLEHFLNTASKSLLTLMNEQNYLINLNQELNKKLQDPYITHFTKYFAALEFMSLYSQFEQNMISFNTKFELLLNGEERLTDELNKIISESEYRKQISVTLPKNGAKVIEQSGSSKDDIANAVNGAVGITDAEARVDAIKSNKNAQSNVPIQSSNNKIAYGKNFKNYRRNFRKNKR